MHSLPILFAFALLALSSWMNQAADSPPAPPRPDFSSYGNSYAIQAYLRTHANSDDNPFRTNAMVLSMFPKGEKFALEYFVRNDGHEADRRYVYAWAFQGDRGKKFSPSEFQQFNAHLQSLPHSVLTPPLNRLVIVSFRKNKEWLTYTYDYRNLPKPLRQILDLIGERRESLDLD